MILEETKRFGEIEIGTYFGYGGAVVQKIDDDSVVICMSHLWSATEGRFVTREWEGTHLSIKKKHFCYAGDIKSFLPYVRKPLTL